MNFLKKATIHFYTPMATADKKMGVQISVIVYDINRVEVARLEHFAADLYFPDDGSNSAEFALRVVPKVEKANLLHGSFDVVISHIGFDSWVFIPFLGLNFEDGSLINNIATGNRVVNGYATETTLVF